MVGMIRCPAAEQLKAWVRRPADCPEAQALAAHVDECPHCQRALEQLTALGGPILGRLEELALLPPPGGAGGPTKPLTSRALGSQPPHLESEIRDLLQRRLRLFGVAAGGVFLGLLTWRLAEGVVDPVYIRYGDR